MDQQTRNLGESQRQGIPWRSWNFWRGPVATTRNVSWKKKHLARGWSISGSLWSLTSTSINQPKRWFHGIIFHRNIVGFKVWTLVQTQQGSVGCWFILGGTERHVPDRIPRDPALPTYFMSFVDVDVLWHGFSIQYINKYIYICVYIYICIYMCICTIYVQLYIFL
jgi:hypothetical protein